MNKVTNLDEILSFPAFNEPCLEKNNVVWRKLEVESYAKDPYGQYYSQESLNAPQHMNMTQIVKLHEKKKETLLLRKNSNKSSF